jgi:CRISPR-associated endonuclease/helicase Cas3
MLKFLSGITPFVLMTATFSQTMLDNLCATLGAEKVTLTPDEVANLPSHANKQRRYRYTACQLTPEAVIEDFLAHPRRRGIVVCNRPERVQALAAELRDDPRLRLANVEIRVLHSRLYASDREKRETEIGREFGEDRSQYGDTPMILVATQVIEVGVNITCEVLHTEIASAAAIIQRAGRCARFANESGEVLVYDVPQAEDGTPDFAPYLDPKGTGNDDTTEGQGKLCARSLEVFASLPPDGKILTYHDELALVDAAHHEFDQALLHQLRDNRHTLRQMIQHTLRDQDRSFAKNLIRHIDNRTVLLHHDPTSETLPHPYRCEGISIRKTRLMRWYRDVQQQALDMGLEWVIRIPDYREDVESEQYRRASDEEPEQRRRRYVVYERQHCPSLDPSAIQAACSDIASSGLVVLNAALAQYDQLLGFQFAIGPASADNSPEATSRKPQDDASGPIRRETYADHITGLYHVYRTDLQQRTAAVRRRLEEQHHLAPGTLDRAIRLMFAVHDLGKLDATWQEWAHTWQAKVCTLRNTPEHTFPNDYMAAHTDFDSQNAEERRASARVQPQRPNHAAESARAGRVILEAVAQGCEPLYVALVSAVICHHSPTLRDNHGKWQPVGGRGGAAQRAFNEAMKCVGLHDDAVLLQAIRQHASPKPIPWEGFPELSGGLSEEIIDVEHDAEVVLYLLLVRIVRLADQRSQEHL